MHEYDVTLKSVLRRSTGTVIYELTGFNVTHWHNVELPAVQNRRADLLGEAADGTLVHIELQSTNEDEMALRMLEYAIAIHRQFGRFPHQLVLYVGNAPLRMRGEIAGPNLKFSCRIVDIRELDSEPLITSSRVEDNVIAVLARLGSEREAVRRILGRIAECEPPQRTTALTELMLLAGLRKLGPVIQREAEQMPILDDIMDHAVLGRERRKGIEIGREQGLEEGIEKGLEKGLERARGEALERQRRIVLRLIGKRFGPVPEAARQRIEALSWSEIEAIELRLLDVQTLDELLG